MYYVIESFLQVIRRELLLFVGFGYLYDSSKDKILLCIANVSVEIIYIS